MSEEFDIKISQNTRLKVYQLKLGDLELKLKQLKDSKETYEYERYRQLYVRLYNKIKILKQKIKKLKEN